MTDFNRTPALAVGPKAKALQPYVQAVDDQRDRLIQSIAEFDKESRQEVLYRMERLAWNVFSGVAAGAAGIAASLLLKKLWGDAFNRGVPPEDPSDPNADWVDAVGWTVITGVGVGVATLVARRGAAKGWKKLTGSNPIPYQ
ncbi:DUF4235 domain-containing protein [Stomatohabitans albus]|uniref:DUF4235 domain-containing protein n=1 Tax=Stomatohabitans albus TaxID=3110766 RepID=UPI00300C124A